MPALALSDLERRTIAHLGQPRNVVELAHELRRDQYTPTRDEQAVHDHLVELADAGLVVNLGEHADASSAAAAHKKGALRMPDEQARIFEKRLAAPHRSWRLQGDLWRLSEAGLEMLLAPPPGVSTMMAQRAAIERMLREHARQIIDVAFEGSIFDEDGGRLLEDVALNPPEFGAPPLLLPEEYRHWAQVIADEFERETGEKLTMPVAGGAGYSDRTEDLIQAADAGGTAYQDAAPTYMALTTVAVTDTMTGTTITEATGATGYARKSCSSADIGTSTNGSRANANAIVGAGITAGTATVIGFARCTAATVGQVIRYGTCASTVISATQTPWQFAVGALTDTLD